MAATNDKKVVVFSKTDDLPDQQRIYDKKLEIYFTPEYAGAVRKSLQKCCDFMRREVFHVLGV